VRIAPELPIEPVWPINPQVVSSSLKVGLRPFVGKRISRPHRVCPCPQGLEMARIIRRRILPGCIYVEWSPGRPSTECKIGIFKTDPERTPVRIQPPVNQHTIRQRAGWPRSRLLAGRIGRVARLLFEKRYLRRRQGFERIGKLAVLRTIDTF